MKVNSGTILIGFFAILSGLVGVHLYREATKPKPLPVVAQPAPPKNAAPRKMVVPMVSRNISPGQRISIDDIALVRLTRLEMDKLGIAKVFMTNADQIIGKTVKRELKRGTTFDTRDFYPVGQGPGIAHRLKPGYRAVTIALSPTNALIGFAGAGQNVDVLFHYGGSSNGGMNGGSMGGMQSRVVGNQNRNRGGLGYANPNLIGATSTLVQDAEILALNHTTTATGDPNGINSSQQVLVTLAVKPESAELLRVARGHGDLSLTLRSPNDTRQVPIYNPTTFDKIIKIEPEKVNEMQIYRGKALSTLRFAGTTGGGVVGRYSGYAEPNSIANADSNFNEDTGEFYEDESDFVAAEGNGKQQPEGEVGEPKSPTEKTSNTKFISMPKTMIRDGVRMEYTPRTTGNRRGGSGSRNRQGN